MFVLTCIITPVILLKEFSNSLWNVPFSFRSGANNLTEDSTKHSYVLKIFYLYPNCLWNSWRHFLPPMWQIPFSLTRSYKFSTLKCCHLPPNAEIVLSIMHMVDLFFFSLCEVGCTESLLLDIEDLTFLSQVGLWKSCFWEQTISFTVVSIFLYAGSITFLIG